MKTALHSASADHDTFRGIDRLVNLSDAVISIAGTLLILPLADKVTQHHISSFQTLVDACEQQFFIFLLSFVVICRFWLIHHNMFAPLRKFNPAVFWLNAAWLLTIVMIPFTSELIGGSGGEHLFITIIYIGTLVMTSYIDVAIQWTVLHSPELHKPSFSGQVDLTPGIAAAIAMTLALLLSIVFPSLGPWSLLILIPANYVADLFQKSRS
jgi:uncharacterized membrane protein